MAGLAVLAAVRAGAAEEASGFTVAPVAPGVFAAIADADAGGEAGGNAGFVVGEDAVVVVDSFATPRAARRLLAEIRRTTPLPVRWLVNTRLVPDHAGGDPVFESAGAVIVAHEGPPATGVSAARPSVTFRDSLAIWPGKERVEVFSLPGYVEGSALVFVPAANVLFGGDLLLKAHVPDLTDADTQAWIAALDGIARRFPTAVWVPGHGSVARPLDLRALRDYLVGLRSQVARGLAEGRSGAELSAALLPRLLAQCRGWSGTERLARNVAHVEAELTGRKGSAPEPTP